jgi:hypothetical protein
MTLHALPFDKRFDNAARTSVSMTLRALLIRTPVAGQGYYERAVVDEVFRYFLNNLCEDNAMR